MTFRPPDILDFSQVIAPPVLGENFLPLPHIRKIAVALRQVMTGTLPGGKKNLIINIPPRHGKTMFACELFPAFGLGVNPGAKFIVTGSTIGRARRSSIRVKGIVESREFQRIFPWTRIDHEDTDSQDEWYTTKKGGLYAVGSTGSIIGFGAGSDRTGWWGCIIIDDPLKYLEARSETVRQSVIDNLTGGIMTRINGEHTPIIMIMQRLHPMDPCGWVLKNFPDDWHLLSLPCVNPDGSMLWPGKISPEYLRKLKEVDPFTYHNQYQQSPIMPGGNMIKEEWWGRWTRKELNKCRGLFMTADTAFKKIKTADYSAISVWAYSPEHILLVDQKSGRWDWNDLVREAESLVDKYKPVRSNELPLGPLVIEDKASGTSLIQHLNAKRINVSEWSPEGKDKIFWGKSLAMSVYEKKVLIPCDDKEEFPWLEEFIREASEFSGDGSHAHDDKINTAWIADGIWRNSGGIIGG